MNIDELNRLCPTRNFENKWAMFSLNCAKYSLLGLFGLVYPLHVMIFLLPIGAVVGILAGVVALVLIILPGSRYTGLRQALLGVVCCGILFVVPGLFYASLSNYARGSERIYAVKEITMGLMIYAEANEGKYPTSLESLKLEPEKLYARKYYFYILYTKSPYMLNAHLAGKNIDTIANPERTILVAEGRQTGKALFESIDEFDFNKRCTVGFVDGHAMSIDSNKVSQYFSANGVVDKSTLFIVPKFVGKGEGSAKR